LVQAGLLAYVCLFLWARNANAQSGHRLGAATGEIILVKPKKGSLKIKRSTGGETVDAAVGMPVHRGNLLILDEKDPAARASVICGDGKTHELMPGAQGCPCAHPCPREICGINYDDSTLTGARGADTGSSFPVVISPRKTRLLTTRPVIRWSSIRGGKENTIYKVTLYRASLGTVVWSREVTAQTTLVYPDKEPPLMPGQTYRVVVSAAGRSSEEDDSPGLGFAILTEHDAKLLANQVAKIKQLRLPDTETRFLISTLLAARDLYAEAIEGFNDVLATLREPAVARMLGDAYAEIGLNPEAERQYLVAANLQDSADLEGVALLQRALANIYEKLGIFEKAVASLEKAADQYAVLGDSTKAEELRKRAKALRDK